MDITPVISTLINTFITPVVVSILIYVWQRNLSKRDEARKKEFLLNMNMGLANGKLTKAVALAYKRGHLNGELDEALKDYDDSKEEYLKFLNEQVSDYMT